MSVVSVWNGDGTIVKHWQQIWQQIYFAILCRTSDIRHLRCNICPWSVFEMARVQLWNILADSLLSILKYAVWVNLACSMLSKLNYALVVMVMTMVTMTTTMVMVMSLDLLITRRTIFRCILKSRILVSLGTPWARNTVGWWNGCSHRGQWCLKICRENWEIGNGGGGQGGRPRSESGKWKNMLIVLPSQL